MATDIGKLSARDLHVISGDGELCIRDVRLGGRLGYSRADDVRQLIKDNTDELQDYGSLRQRAAKSIGGRPADEFWLNEGQAILICFLSRALNARSIRKEVIEAFLAYRRGEHPATPLTDALLAPPVPAVERDENVLHITHEDWSQTELPLTPKRDSERQADWPETSLEWSRQIERDVTLCGHRLVHYPPQIIELYRKDTDCSHRPMSEDFKQYVAELNADANRHHFDVLIGEPRRHISEWSCVWTEFQKHRHPYEVADEEEGLVVMGRPF